MNKVSEPEGPSSAGDLARGQFWMVSLRWAIRLTGLVSTIVLARLLTPADFGVVAIAMLVVGSLEVLSQTGQTNAIVRNVHATREHYDSAWTISLLIGIGIATLILLLGPLASIYFHEPRAIPVMQCLALRSLLGGFANIGTVTMRRDLQFDRFFWFNLYPKLVSFAITIPLAILLRNYWALTIGMIVGAVTTNILSYRVSSYRPRISFSKVGELWSFSIWTLIRSITAYFNERVDQFAIGGIFGTPAMGRYAVAADVSTSPTTEINGPLLFALFPVMVRVQHDPVKLRELYLWAVGWSAIVCASTSVGVAVISVDFVREVLGSQWVDMTPLVPYLALGAGVLGLAGASYSSFDNLGLPHRAARMQILRLVMLGLAVGPVAYFTRDLEYVAMTRLIVIIVFLPTLFTAIGRAIGVGLLDYLSVLWRPILSSMIMAAAVLSLNFLLPFDGLFRMLLDMGVGAITYGAALFGMWYLSGEPRTPEQFVAAYLRKKLAR
jgi:O-antigen/teichoic acid export membrane protein